MKKRMISFALALLLIASITSTACAATDTGKRALYGPTYQEITTATFIDQGCDGRLLLSLSSSPDATAELIDGLSFVCNIVGAVNFGSFSLSSFFPGCDYVDLGEKFYKYVDKTMRLDIRLTDAGTGDFIWEGTMKDGDVIFLGNDHPTGYRIECKSHGTSLFPWVKLQVLENLDIS